MDAGGASDANRQERHFEILKFADDEKVSQRLVDENRRRIRRHCRHQRMFGRKSQEEAEERAQIARDVDPFDETLPNFSGRRFADLFESEAMSVVEPNVQWLGGNGE